ncbi:hypothetical protein MVEN_00560500 [Mycena venus]|uniref:C2H2-type domain-containing protein n=1 Tax=Mycena venus TaxID=2733690 RepID=A0A8H6YJ90_9AGAR|nr:hypothetical protein MVEN_00560500 [Mycena venus]
MSSSTTLLEPPSTLGKRKRKYLLHLSTSPEPSGFSDFEFQPHASTSKSLPILINGTLVAHTKKRYKCTHTGCDKAYSKPSRLEEHERSHSGQRPFVCETCGKSYLRETHLHAHARSHLPQSDRPFACSQPNCEKRFWTAQHLRVHLDWHNGAKPFICSETNCLETFAKHHQLRAHRCTVHAAPGTKPYQCEHEGCTQSFTTNQHLRTHSKVHNEKRYACSHPTCLAASGDTITFYPTWTALQHHNRTEHPPTCLHPSCNDRTFSSQKGLRAHQKIHEQQAAQAEIDAAVHDEDVDGEPPRKKRRGGEVGRDWKCDVDGCTKDFKSKKALTTHTNITHLGRRDHVCPHETCKQTFGYKHLLQRHLTKRHNPSSSSESSDEDTTCLPAPVAMNLDIDTITGNTYAQTASKKLKAAKALRCPYPHLDGLTVAQTGPPCDYVFSRAYDFRRHLQSEHNVIFDKKSVDLWVQKRWPEQA